MEKLKQLQEQANQIVNEFQTNINIATKPYQDLARSFSALMQVTNAIIQTKDERIAELEGQVVKQANKDATPPPT